MTTKINYPAIKKAAWEAWRVFLPALAAVIYAQFQSGVDLKNWKAWATTLLVSAAVAGAKAVFKWTRETYGNGDYSKFIYKLPI